MVRREIQTAVNRLTVFLVVVSLIATGSFGAVALGGGNAAPAATTDAVGTQQSADSSLAATQSQSEIRCGSSTGDPHLTTFDGLAYDFHNPGEFVLSNSSQYTAQVRQEKVDTGGFAAINTAFAIGFNGNNVTLNITQSPTLIINGTEVPLEQGTYPVGNGTVKVHSLAEITIRLPGPDGVAGPDDTRVNIIISTGLNIRLCANVEHAGPITGLLGSPDGIKGNDIKVRNGTVLGNPADGDVVYNNFTDSWAVRPNSSLFNYATGEGPSSYYDESVPTDLPEISDFSQSEVDAARDKAEAAGLQPGTVNFRNGVLDYLVTGDESFFEAAKLAPELPEENLVEVTEPDGEEEETPSGALRAGHTAPDRRTAD